ncbi:RacP protein [Streptomyces sp. C10]|uniref:RacP protein n=1 Tax=Streptomyces sp. C10 TaxID=531941 RepID=UPI003980A752
MPRPAQLVKHADSIRFVLFEARPAGLLFHQLVRANDLSPSQVRAGLAALRDEAAAKGWPPLTWTGADGYQLGAEQAALEAYERQVIREKLTEFRRFITGSVAPHAAALPGDKWVRHIVPACCTPQP